MKFGQTLLHQSVPEWRKKYINYKALKKSIKRINISKQKLLSEIENTITNNKSSSKFIHASSSNIISELPEETDFKHQLDSELEKINNFYSEREIEVVNKLILIVQQIEIYSSNNETRRASQVKPIDAFLGVFSHKKRENFSRDLESSDTSVINDVKFKSKKAKSKLKNALLELYREMFLLKNYKILNYTGFVKILKKYDKTMKRQYSEIYIEKVDHSHFHTSKILDKVIKQTENIYVKTFFKGNRNAGMNDLRIPDDTDKEQHSVIWRSGFCLGLGLPIIYSIISQFINEDLTKKINNLEIILQIYGGLSLPIIFLLLFGVNLIVWKKYKINYVFIFEFDSRKHLAPWQFIEIACLLFVLWVYFVYFALTDFFSISTHLYPIILIVIYLGILFLPFRVFYPQARKWIIKIIGRLVCAPFFFVRFADFFLGDQFMSISYIFTVIEILICAEYNNIRTMEYKCNSSKSWFISIVTVVPGWIRFLQCLRRYYDTRHFNHMLNAGKYIVGIFSILLGTLAKIKGHLILRIIWIISLVATTSYSYTWDVKMDWGFFKKNSKNKFLRNDLIFPTWSYYYVMISNLFLRTIWLFTVSPNYWGVIKNGNIVAYATALVEVIRRFQWNFFRMENEHTNNCGEFRAVKEMPLPYHINNNNDDDEDGNNHDTLHDIPSNLQIFIKKINRNKDNQYNDSSDDSKDDNNSNSNSGNANSHNKHNSYAKGNNIDITNMNDFQRKTSNSGSISSSSESNGSVKLKRSHSQELISSYRDSKVYDENDTINISNVKFWNIKPGNMMMMRNKNFDLEDPLNSNRTIHTYNVDNEFNQYLSKVKDNLSSIDTIIKKYDAHNDNQLSIKIEKFMDNHQTLDIFDLHRQKLGQKNVPSNSKSPLSKTMVELSKYPKGSDTLLIESEKCSFQFKITIK